MSFTAVFAGILLLLNSLYPLNLPRDNALFARITVDDRGRPLRAFADQAGVWRYPISLQQVSPLYLEALLTYEDRWFWYHPGVNPLALIRASFQNLLQGRVVSGGSTISMQVARLLHPHRRTWVGKARQILRTLQLEWQLDKNEILNLYLNIAPFGGTIEGVQAASYSYLNKSAANLSHAEAALLAVLPQAPTRYRPDSHSQMATVARNKVLDRMAVSGRWSAETVAEAKIETVHAYRARPQQLAPLLSRRLLKNADGQRAIKTTINGSLQQALEDYLSSYIHRLPEKTSAAILVVDNETAAVKAYLGSADFSDPRRFGHVDMIQAIRSPGSTLKPFLFGMAIDEGLIHSHSLLADVPRSWGSYRPSNFNNQYSGPVSASEALQRSLNVPFIDLLERYGPRRFAAALQGAGLNLKIPGGMPNLAIILGGAGTTLEQLVSGYMAFARGGKTVQLKYLQQDLAATEHERYLLSAGAAWITQRTLSSVTRPGSLNTLASVQTAQSMAWKTGTSFGFRDTWAIGVAKKYTIGVWVGRPDGTPLQGHSGRETAGPLLFAVADHIQLQPDQIEQPSEVSQQEICWPLGIYTSVSEHCHRLHTAWTVDENVPPTWHRADNDAWQTNPFTFWINTATGLRVDSHCGDTDEPVIKQKKTVALWPKVLDPWLPAKIRRATQIPFIDSSCDQHIIDTSSTLKITGIVANSIYRAAGSSTVYPSVTLQAIGGNGNYHWYINGVRRYSGSGRRVIPHPLKERGDVQILVVDDSGNIDKLDIRVM
ncbi:penicillin-binding protein 1C [Motiliproteus sp. MSK22-1]|nr:penicillin-binding protein 1C [Motiliproteus sp. MSK22-1]